MCLSSQTIRETEIRRIAVPARSGKKVYKTTPPNLNRENLDTVAHACHPSYKIGGLESRPS
jgi:hypothetical protein